MSPLLQQVKHKVTSEGILAWVAEQSLEAELGGGQGVLRMVLRALLVAGAKSFTHMITALERYCLVLQTLLAQTGSQVCWQHHLSLGCLSCALLVCRPWHLSPAFAESADAWASLHEGHAVRGTLPSLSAPGKLLMETRRQAGLQYCLFCRQGPQSRLTWGLQEWLGSRRERLPWWELLRKCGSRRHRRPHRP